MGLSPHDVSTTTLGKFAAFKKGFNRQQAGGDAAKSMSDQEFEDYMIKKHTEKPKEPKRVESIADLLSKMHEVK